jgi:hypothetical protein
MAKWHLILIAELFAIASVTSFAADEESNPSMKTRAKESKEQVTHDAKAVPGGLKATGKAFVDLGKRGGHALKDSAKQAKSNLKGGTKKTKESATGEAKSSK